ncbi:Glycosyltransferase involved in cell wall bisynthesis [Halopseudomonas litoralis]|uniref:Glycosyltransferase involved in cell wall bisynthesis n=1 Tax=Halopseudomonas litoralis TaxID=797277 RepID=A0A1H1S9B3_9GAMM|nr:glycosyltransferase [Halopseudomonas litoralis]SDS44552.1 Glycosyltransferase involved in cell wall bisynthesis [Halopseudomonas litoralis]
MKFLFFFPKINNYPNFKPLINIVNYLIDKGGHVFIATDTEVDQTVSSQFSDAVVFLQRGSNKSRLKWARELIRKDFDCFIGVQAHNSYWLALGKMFELQFRKKVISWEHSSPVSSLKNEYTKVWLLHLMLKKFFSIFTNAYFCVSRGAVNEMRGFLKGFGGKAMYSPNLIYKSTDLALLNKKDFSKKKIKFISVGRLSREKGLFLALDALAKLKNVDYEYIIVGDGPCYTELFEYVKNHSDLNGKVQFLGRRKDVLLLMMNSDVVLLPSYFEGLPTVLVEACIAGLPIIAADCETGPAEIVEEGINGYLFEVGNVSDLHNKIEQWIASRKSIINSSYYARDYSEMAGEYFMRNMLEVIGDK